MTKETLQANKMHHCEQDIYSILLKLAGQLALNKFLLVWKEQNHFFGLHKNYCLYASLVTGVWPIREP